MERKFNITGNCFAHMHYMADVSRKLAQVRKMVDEGEYFIINRPRQYGKTTTLFMIADTLAKTGEYLVFNISFEGLSDQTFQNETRFCSRFVELLAKSIKRQHPLTAASLNEMAAKVTNLDDLSDNINDLAYTSDKKLVLLIDEVDKSSNNQLFISFLGILRTLYLNRTIEPTFHAVVLAGVHDVKSLKLKIREGEEAKLNSPWNIAAEFKVDMNLQPFEIKPMLDDYVADKGVKMDTAAMAEDLFYYTSGYPFLVSKLCKILDEDILPTKDVKEWTESDLEWAVKQLTLEPNTNFESLIKNLENTPELYQIAYKMLVYGEYQDFNIYDPLVSMGVMFGIFKNGHGIKIHNKIYEEVIYHYMTSKTKSQLLFGGYTASKDFKVANNVLNMELVLQKFQAFMEEQYSKQDRDFLERHGRLVFLAFLKPIINGHGYDFKEVEISEERRLDITITYYQHKYVAELKIWRGQVAHEKGLTQLNDYLNRLKLTEGYLVIFDHSAVKTWHSEWITHNGKNIFIVWV